MSGKERSLPERAGDEAKRPAWMWIIVLVGYFLPCVIGIVVWFYLRSLGKPVMPIDWIVAVIPTLCFFSAIWVLPFLAVLLMAGYTDLHKKRNKGMIYCAFLGTLFSEVVVFGSAWKNVEVVVMGFLFLPAVVFIGTIALGTIGYLTGKFLEGRPA